MQNFRAVFNCSNRADREKNKSNYRFPSIVKNNGKEGLILSKVRRKKSLAQIFRNNLTEVKLEKTKMKIMLSASPSLFFSHKVHNIRFEKQIRILSQLSVIELGPPVPESSTGISKFHDPTDSEHKFYKTRIGNWLSIVFELGKQEQKMELIY